MRPGPVVVMLVLVTAGCATGPRSTPEEAAYFADCRDGAPDDADAALAFAGRRYQLHWQRRCDNAALRLFRAPGGEDGQERLVTLALYPPEAEPRRILDATIARSASRRVGEPQIFERKGASGTRYIAELMLQRETSRQLEYLLHGVTTSEAGRVVSVTYTYRFRAANDAAVERIQADQRAWVRAVERHLGAFPAPSKGDTGDAD